MKIHVEPVGEYEFYESEIVFRTRLLAKEKRKILGRDFFRSQFTFPGSTGVSSFPDFLYT